MRCLRVSVVAARITPVNEQAPQRCGPSSSKLKTDVANFMERADEIAEHPLATHPPSFQVVMARDPESTLITAMNVDWQNLDRATWVYVAVLMRPIAFLTDDDISLVKLLDRIGEEHETLAKFADKGKALFEEWQTHMYVGQQNLGTVPEKYQGLPSGSVTRFELGPPDTVPDGIDIDKIVPDYQLAKIYLNGHLWHSDTKKAAEFMSASPNTQAFYAKCAEIRTLTAIEHVLGMRQFFLNAREKGHDL